MTTASYESLQSKIDQAASCFNVFWPLTNFIACNPLKGYEGKSFDEAMNEAGAVFGSRGFLELAEYRAMYESGRIAAGDFKEAFERLNGRPVEIKVAQANGKMRTLSELLDACYQSKTTASINRQMIKWCAAYLDTTQAQWQMERQGGLFKSWRKLALLDHSLSIQGVRDWKKNLLNLPEDALAALAKLLNDSGVEGEDIIPYLTRHFVQLKGWTSHLKWRQSQGENNILTDYLAIRLFYELNYAAPILEQAQLPRERAWQRLALKARTQDDDKTEAAKAADYSSVWQEAYELNYRNRLLKDLDTGAIAAEANEQAEKSAHLVFCIDVRSEPIRRQIEKIGPYSTSGFAGFFGFAMKFTALGSALSVDLCPVLLKPEKEVKENARDRAGNFVVGAQALRAAVLQLRKRMKSNLIGAFGLVENFGLFSAVPLAGATLFPGQYSRFTAALSQMAGGKARTKLDTSAYTLEEKIELAWGNLKAMGLPESFPKIVVLCGHKSQSRNNPYASSLDCGACGANGGGASARLAAEIFNDNEVRAGLESKGLVVPEETVFIAAEHNTTTDTFEFFDSEAIAQSHRELFESLRADLKKAGQEAQDKRRATLPQSVFEQLNNPAVRAGDWAQVAPEWGLAGNAAFIAAPRALSRSADLKGRAFLHSYEYTNDSNGKILELIMTAPMIVAQWINMQYYLSTVDNEVFGSGSKVTHNVVGDFGVMQGATGDLRLGLPLQSVMQADGTRAHEPIRLISIIRAPRESIDQVLARHAQVSDLVKNRWIRLIALEPADGKFYQANDALRWEEIVFTADSHDYDITRLEVGCMMS
ncbi:MAG: DUF2309 domain-containing protein [Cyanobacteria bacterium SZAS LIN-3]|nr:DUF2309 domain-containing protein [Cyanobacteria bacterium SZAS LIN-3]